MSDENRFLEVESLQTLINAVSNYLEELGVSYNFLAEAANVCQMAMGSDEIAMKQINRMYEALEGLRVAALTAQEVAQDMQTSLMQAEAIRNM
ncbi:MAG: hypothetical protein NC121_04865 [Blautia sp.]|nr:hypothetical protein [Blautia sp.]